MNIRQIIKFTLFLIALQQVFIPSASGQCPEAPRRQSRNYGQLLPAGGNPGGKGRDEKQDPTHLTVPETSNQYSVLPVAPSEDQIQDLEDQESGQGNGRKRGKKNRGRGRGRGRGKG